VWNAPLSRVEMHLVSRMRQTVHVEAADLTVDFEDGEWIWTESSYKYEPDQVIATAGEAGFEPVEQWIDQNARFALTLFRAARCA
jgi:uncharacterized SAM-dependent methyltransferase